jgi:RNA polymerase sigma factor (sigma-70 family)
MPDSELLQKYIQSGSESAFAELVQSHLDLVYSTALRALNGDEHLAKDVSQSVFIDLARKAASLSRRPTLTGWLYTSTCFAAAKAARAERRRQVREGEVHSMREQIGDTGEPDWEQIRPLLDTVMLELKDGDREALLLRFFERRSLAEVGTKLGLSQNAARMRVERALERLRGRLTRRGVTSSGAALGLMLMFQAVGAAPAGLSGYISACSTVATASTSYSFLNLVSMTNIKTVCIGAAIAATVTTPIIIQQRTNDRLRAEIEAVRKQLSEMLPGQQSSAVADRAEIEQLRRDNADLLRLRNEITALRQTVASMTNNLKEMERV